jgi:hypothetical protein
LPKNRKAASSSYRGVSFIKANGKWRAAIEVDGQARNLGSFALEGNAALAYNDAALEYFGPGAYQNPVGRRKNKRGSDHSRAARPKHAKATKRAARPPRPKVGKRLKLRA